MPCCPALETAHEPCSCQCSGLTGALMLAFCQFREVWAMNLSATRNRIIRINLMVTVAAFALTACIVPASFFGMNIDHGVEARAHCA